MTGAQRPWDLLRQICCSNVAVMSGLFLLLPAPREMCPGHPLSLWPASRMRRVECGPLPPSRVCGTAPGQAVGQHECGTCCDLKHQPSTGRRAGLHVTRLLIAKILKCSLWPLLGAVDSPGPTSTALSVRMAGSCRWRRGNVFCWPPGQSVSRNCRRQILTKREYFS